MPTPNDVEVLAAVAALDRGEEPVHAGPTHRQHCWRYDVKALRPAMHAKMIDPTSGVPVAEIDQVTGKATYLQPRQPGTVTVLYMPASSSVAALGAALPQP